MLKFETKRIVSSEFRKVLKIRCDLELSADIGLRIQESSVLLFLIIMLVQLLILFLLVRGEFPMDQICFDNVPAHIDHEVVILLVPVLKLFGYEHSSP